MFCRNCGKELTGSPGICLDCGARPLQGTDFCQHCGAPTTPLTEVCVNCGMRVAKSGKVGASSSSGSLTAGGVLVIICGVLGILGGLVNAIGSGAAIAFGGGLEEVFYIVIGTGGIVLGVVAIIGGAYALKRRNFTFAIVGAVCGFLAAGPLCCGLLLGVPALVLIIVSRDRFDEHEGLEDSDVLYELR